MDWRPRRTTCLALTAVGAFSFVAVSEFVNGSEARAVEKIRSLGYATGRNELVPKSYPPDQDAANTLGPRLEQLLLDDHYKRTLEALRQPLSGDATVLDLAAGIAAREPMRNVIGECEAASRLPAWSFREIDGSVVAGRLLDSAAYLDSSTGDLQAAFEKLRAAGRISGQVQGDPNFESLYSALAIQSHLVRTLLRCLRQHLADLAAIQLANRTLQEMPPMPDLVRAVEGEFVLERGILEKAVNVRWVEQLDPRERLGEDYFMLSKPVVKLAIGQAYGAWTVAFRNLPKDPTDWRKVQSALNKADASLYAGRICLDHRGFFFPSVRYRTDFWVRTLAERRMINVSGQLLGQRAAGHPLPETLDKFGQDAIDPYVDRPLGYRRIGNGFVVYSVGRDVADDGGNPNAKPQRDIVFEFK